MTSPDGSEPVSLDYQREIISKAVRDISEGRLVIRVDQKDRRPEDIDLIGTTVGKLITYMNDYVSGIKAGEELEFLERQLYFCISVLRTYDVLKTNTDESKLEESMRRLESKVDALSLQFESNQKKPTSKRSTKNRKRTRSRK